MRDIWYMWRPFIIMAGWVLLIMLLDSLDENTRFMIGAIVWLGIFLAAFAWIFGLLAEEAAKDFKRWTDDDRG